jgi:transcriptional regulator with XRE-family HTH domain
MPRPLKIVSPDTLGERFRATRQALSLSLAEVAGTNYSNSLISQIERNKKKKQLIYSAADIQVLEGIAAIGHRPGMYIGSTSATGLLYLIWEAPRTQGR